jgi:ankyrin repeat protein
MGTWDFTPFGNDTALDWLLDLSKATEDSILAKPLAVVLASTETPDSPECEEAVASAAVICAACRVPLGKLPDEARDWVNANGYVPCLELIEQAMAALRRVIQDSELLYLWEESGQDKRWKKAVGTLLEGLTSASAAPLPVRKVKKPPTPKLLAEIVRVITPKEQSARRETLRKLLAELTDVNASLKLSCNEPPLCMLAARGLVPEAASLLERGADPNAISGLGYGPLKAAAIHGQAEMVDLLLKHGADLYETISIHRTRKIPVNTDDKDAVPFTYALGLFEAARKGSIATLEVLTAHGADLRQVDLNGSTLLHKAAEGGIADMIKYLVNCGFDINQQTTSLNETALHMAIREKRTEAVQCLLSLGADPNLTDKISGTPLDILRQFPNEQIGNLLLQYKARLSSEL